MEYTVLKQTPTFVVLSEGNKNVKLSRFCEVFEFLFESNFDPKTIKKLLKLFTFLSKQDIEVLKAKFCPTALQNKKNKERKEKFTLWANSPNKELDRVANKMASAPGFLGNGITKNEVISSIPAELLANLEP